MKSIFRSRFGFSKNRKNEKSEKKCENQLQFLKKNFTDVYFIIIQYLESDEKFMINIIQNNFRRKSFNQKIIPIFNLLDTWKILYNNAKNTNKIDSIKYSLRKKMEDKRINNEIVECVCEIIQNQMDLSNYHEEIEFFHNMDLINMNNIDDKCNSIIHFYCFNTNSDDIGGLKSLLNTLHPFLDKKNKNKAGMSIPKICILFCKTLSKPAESYCEIHPILEKFSGKDVTEEDINFFRLDIINSVI